MKKPSVQKTMKAHCYNCGEGIFHAIRGRYESSWSETLEGGFDIDGGATHFILECAGCRQVSMRKDSWFSEDMDVGPQGMEYVITTTYYPPRLFRKEPS